MGGDPERFWYLTPASVTREIEAMRRIRAREHNERVWMAWHIAALPMMKKFPPIKDLMIPVDGAPRTKRQPPDVLLANLKLAFGYVKPQ